MDGRRLEPLSVARRRHSSLVRCQSVEAAAAFGAGLGRAHRVAVVAGQPDADTRDRVAGRVERDVQSGRANGVDGTPAVFINGERYLGDRDVASLREAVAGKPRTMATGSDT